MRALVSTCLNARPAVLLSQSQQLRPVSMQSSVESVRRLDKLELDSLMQSVASIVVSTYSR